MKIKIGTMVVIGAKEAGRYGYLHSVGRIGKVTSIYDDKMCLVSVENTGILIIAHEDCVLISRSNEYFINKLKER